MRPINSDYDRRAIQAALDANDLETARRIWGEVEDAAITITQGA